jgi:hypothetical protein
VNRQEWDILKEAQTFMRAQSQLALLGAFMFSMVGISQAQERGHVAGVAGWTFGEETAPVYGGQFGIGLSDTISIVGGVERLDDVLTGRYALFIRDVSLAPGVELTGTLPATYGGAGLRWTFPGMTVQPFAQIELGATSISPELRLVLDGDDVTDQIVGKTNLEGTHFASALGAGLRANFADNFLFETTFKFFTIFTDEDLRLNRLTFAFGLRF